jgi:hypothetical protein
MDGGGILAYGDNSTGTVLSAPFLTKAIEGAAFVSRLIASADPI